MKKNYLKKLVILLSLMMTIGNAIAQRKMENLGRGVIATHSSTSEALVSWRLLATEPQDIGFNVYRSANGGAAQQLNSTVLLAGTNFIDATADFTQSNSYFVKPVLNGIEKAASASYILPANTPVQPFFNVPIHNTPGYAAKFIWVGDLDGDGEYDFVFDKQPTDASKNILLEAYKRDGDGTYLWQLDCGPNSVNKDNIVPGSSTLDIGHGDNFTVYDINGDGKAEVIVRTANGVKFGNGAILSETDNNKQFISVLNGMTGEEISRTPYGNPYLSRGPMNGHMGIAYLDGIHPSVVWEAKNRNADNSFNEMTTAWSWNNGTLVQTWQFLTGSQNCPAGHQIRVVDLDGDGKDEVVPMGHSIDHDGTHQWSLGEQGYYHGDRFSIGDLDPSHPGLEGYAIQQINPYGKAWVYYDAKTGAFLNGQTIFPATDLARGMVGDFDPRYKGYEFFTFTDALYNVSGAKTSTAMPSSYPNMRIWWDDDLLSENLDNGKMTKWNYLANREDRISMGGHSSIYGVIQIGPNTPGFYGDILGDWREEIVYEATDHNSLVVLTTPYPTNTRLYTLAQNPEYRNSMCVKGYYQSNMLDYYLGADMVQPPVPPVQKANKYWIGTSLAWDNSSTNWLSSANANTPFANGDTVMFDVRGNNSDTIKLNSVLSPARIWAMNPDGKDYILSGSDKLTGSMDLIKAQLGKFILCGKYTYTGQTQISQGTIVVNGSVESKVLVQARGNLGGIGTLKGGVVLEQAENIEGGRLSPGNGNVASKLGTLTIQGDLAVPGNNNFAFDIIPASSRVNDSIVVNGNLSFTGVNKLLVSFAPTPAPGTYTLIKCTGTLTATSGNFTIDGLSGVPSNLIIEDNQVKIQILSFRSPKSIVWKGSVDNVWNYDKTNFEANATPMSFVPNDSLLFDESGLQKTISLTEVVKVNKLTFNATSDYTLGGTGVITGTTGLTKLNNNTLNIQLLNNTYTGKTIINGGTLAFSTLNPSGTPSSLGAAGTDPDNIQFNGVSVIVNGNGVTDRGMTITGNTTITIPVSNNYLVAGGVVTGSGSLTKDGPGQLAFIGRNTYSGGTILRNGSITLGSNEANEDGLGTGSITIENGSLILADARLHAQLKWGIIIPAGKTASIKMDGNCNALGSLTGAGTLNVTMPYVRTDLNGNWSAFTGNINTTGDFRIDNTYGYGNAAINLVSGVVYSKTAGTAVSIGELSGVANTSLTNANWTIGAKNTDASFAGKIKGNSITKVGTGSWTLTDTCTYTGATTVNGGKLIIASPGIIKGTGAVTVNTGATLAGNGTIAGQVTIASGGTIAPGNNAIGSLIINNNLILAAGSITNMEVNSTLTTDTIHLSGNMAYNGTLSITNTSASTFAAGQSYRLFKATTYSGSFTSITPAIPGPGLGWDTTALRTSGTIRIRPTQTLTFGTLEDKTFGDAPFNLTGSSSSGLPATYTSSDPSVVTISESMVTIVGSGSVIITASQPGDANYLPADNVTQTLVVNKASQSITFSDLPSKKVGDAPFDLTATSSSGLPIAYESSNVSVATISGSTVTIVSAGNTNIQASQAGNANYNAADDITRILNITSTSAGALSEQQIVIAPNPVVDYLRITFRGNVTNADIDIYTLSGVHLYHQKIADKNTMIPMTQYKPGMYMVKIIADEGILVKQIIKQ